MTEDKNLKELVSGLTKFLEWQDEHDLVRSHLTEGDLAGELMKTLGIPADEIRVLIGGSNAPIFKRAADEIKRQRAANPMYPKTRADFAALILKGIVCGLKWEMLPDGTRGWRWDGYLRDAEVKELCDFVMEDYPKEMRGEQ